MTAQPEQILERNLISQLERLGYKSVAIKDENELLSNLKKQLEKHNKVVISEPEFKQILNQINKGNVFERSKILSRIASKCLEAIELFSIYVF